MLSTPAPSTSSIKMASAVFVTPSRSTRDCSGSVRWLFPAAVIKALRISIRAAPVAGWLDVRKAAEFRESIDHAGKKALSVQRGLGYEPHALYEAYRRFGHPRPQLRSLNRL